MSGAVTKKAPEIRDLTAADEAAWRGIWDEYLTYYEVSLAPEVTSHTWSRLMDPAAPLNGRVAVQDGRLLGFALHLTHGSTWVIGEDCYLEDLCVTEAARGEGIGRALLEDLVALARERGWNRLYWHTNETNARARALYDTFVQSDGHIRYRMRL
ncbi:GNAT family N-acetyltransferase [Gemmobacter sp. 24YEA27]|uniref:GNAT family N-acetyltransferase n=1 Tax=Gemmobacter sp. 24YEA27 TaxID=3040672 RepID=UPI0024B37B42|nr:GNAT family N-acetyltransferase [Gemmobacter sp. 24YEA27]